VPTRSSGLPNRRWVTRDILERPDRAGVSIVMGIGVENIDRVLNLAGTLSISVSRGGLTLRSTGLDLPIIQPRRSTEEAA
jgi:hypothetical protein